MKADSKYNLVYTVVLHLFGSDLCIFIQHTGFNAYGQTSSYMSNYPT